MIDIIIVVKIVAIVLYTLSVFILCVVRGQHSVWTHLRKKGHVTIDEWYYTAVEVQDAQYKYWS